MEQIMVWLWDFEQGTGCGMGTGFGMGMGFRMGYRKWNWYTFWCGYEILDRVQWMKWVQVLIMVWVSPPFQI